MNDSFSKSNVSQALQSKFEPFMCENLRQEAPTFGQGASLDKTLCQKEIKEHLGLPEELTNADID